MKKSIVSLLAAAVIGLSLSPVTVHATETTVTSPARPVVEEKKIPEFEGKELDTKVAKEKMKAAVEKLKTMESADMDLNAEIAMAGAEFTFTGNGTLNVKEDMAHFKASFMGQSTEVYFDKGTTYTLTGTEWSKTVTKQEKSIADMIKEAKVTEDDLKMVEQYKVIETKDGDIVLMNKEPLTADSLKKMVPENASQAKETAEETFKEMEDVNLVLNFAMVIDKDDNFKAFYMAGSMEAEGTRGSGLITIEIKNINKAEKIVIPEEALKAEELKIPSMEDLENKVVPATTTLKSK